MAAIKAGQEASRPTSSAPRSSRTAAASTAATPRPVRPIEAMVGFLPRTHGSALFTRGETQAICTTTLGTKDAEQMIDGLEGLSYSRFMLHYNFPPYSVGEVGRFGAPSRRDIGHGKLAWRALHPMLPSARGVPLHDPRPLRHHREQRLARRWRRSAAARLAMMDAGVPLKRPVAGIAMGLILEGKDFAVLSDILGDEDHLGDMDFKVAGTERGHHPPADGHQGRRHHRGDHEGRPRPGQGRPRAHPRRNGQGARSHPRGAVGPRAADRDDADPQGQDPRSHRHRRQGDPRDRRDDRRQGRHRRRGRDQDQLVRPRRRSRPPASGSAASSRSRSSARSTPARSPTSSISARS